MTTRTVHPATAPAPLTRRQRDVLRALVAFQRQFGYPPTMRQLAREVGIRSGSVVLDHLNALERKGYVHREPHQSRAIAIVRLPDDLAPADAGGHRGRSPQEVPA